MPYISPEKLFWEKLSAVQELTPRVFIETDFRGGNTVAFLTDEGFVLIDPPSFPDDARRWQAMLREKGEFVVRAVILSDAHRDRILGPHWFKPQVLIAHAATYSSLSTLPSSYVNTIVNSLTNDPYEQSKFSSAQLLLPTVTFTEKMRLYFGAQTLTLSWQPGPMDGSLWVVFPEQSILYSGDVVVVGTPPYLNSMHSKEWMDALNIIRHRLSTRIIIPGRGNITDKEATEPISSFLRLARRRVRTLYKARRPPSETIMLVHELLALFPPPLESELEMFQQRVRTGLQCVYNEFRQIDHKGTPDILEELEEHEQEENHHASDAF